MRALFIGVVAFCLLQAHNPAYSQVESSQSEKMLFKSLIGTTWSGSAFGQQFDYYFLDNHVLVYRTRNVVYNRSKWHIRNHKVEINLLNNPQFRLQAIFEGERKGRQIIGTAKNVLAVRTGQVGPREIGSILETEDSPWLLEQLDVPISELVDAAPTGCISRSEGES